MKKRFTAKQAIVTVMAIAVATTTGVSVYAAAPKANEVGVSPIKQYSKKTSYFPMWTTVPTQ